MKVLIVICTALLTFPLWFPLMIIGEALDMTPEGREEKRLAKFNKEPT